MSEGRQRKLAAILFADIVGYTAMMQKDETLARHTLSGFHSALKEKVSVHRGEVINDYGDGCLIIFESAVEATNCALALQQEFISEPKVPVRIGLHSGDVFFDQNNVYGDAVNLASRIESLGVPGSVLFSETIRAQIHNKPAFEFKSLGHFDFKNVDTKMEVFALKNVGLPVPKRSEMQGKLNPKKSKSLPLILGGVLISLLVIAFLLSPWGPYGQDTYAKTVAVLPFSAPENSDLDKRFAGQIEDEIRKALAEQTSLGLPKTMGAVDKDTDLNPQVAGRELDVAQVLQGDIKRKGNRVFVTLKLIRTRDGAVLWTDTYEGDSQDITQLQETITSTVSVRVPETIEKERQNPSVEQVIVQPQATKPEAREPSGTDRNIPALGLTVVDVTMRAVGPNGEPLGNAQASIRWELDNREFAETRVRKIEQGLVNRISIPTGRYRIKVRHGDSHKERVIDVTEDGSNQFDFSFIDGQVVFTPKLSVDTGKLSGVWKWTFLRKTNDGTLEEIIGKPGDTMKAVLPIGDYIGRVQAGVINHEFEFTVVYGEKLELDVILGGGIARISATNRQDEGYGDIAVLDENGDMIASDLARNRGKMFVLPVGNYQVQGLFDGKTRTRTLSLSAGEEHAIVLDFADQ